MAVENPKTKSCDFDKKFVGSIPLCQMIAEASLDLIFVIDKKGILRFVNQAAAGAVGLKPAALMGKPMKIFFKASTARRQWQSVSSVFRSGKPVYVENLSQSKNKILWLGTRLTPMKDQRGKIYAVMGVSRDITERIRLQEALAKKEEDFRDLFESSADAIMLLDRDKFLSCNQATLKIFGCKTKEQFLGKHPSEVSPLQQPDGTLSRIAADRQIAMAFKKGHHFFEWMHRRLNGEDFYANVLLTPVFYKGQTILQATVRDITKQKKMETALRESEARLKILAETSPDCIKLLTPKGRLLYLSPGGLAEHNLKPNQVATFSVRGTIGKKSLPLFDRQFKKALKGEGSTFVIDHKPGTANREWCNVTLIPVKDSQGKTKQIFGVSRDITSLKKEEEALRESEIKFKTLVESSPDCIKLLDLKGRTLYLNSGGLKEHGLKPHQVADWILRDTIANKSLPLFDRQFKKALQGEESTFDIEHQHGRANRSWCNITFAPVKNAQGRVLSIMGISRDITLLKKSEEALLTFKLAIQQAAEAIIITDIDGNIVFVNPAFIQLYGYSEKEILGKNPRTWKTDRYDRNFYKNLWKKILSKQSASVEFTNRTKDGRLINMASTISPITDSEGKIIGFLGTQHDVTRERATEAKLKMSESQYRDIVENSPEMIHSVDAQDRLTFVNRTECEILGYTKEELLGMHMCKIYGNEFCKIVRNGFEKLKQAGSLFISEGIMFKKNGEKINVEIDSIAIYDAKGQFSHTRSIIRDVTARKRTEKALREKMDQMEFMNRLNLKRYQRMMEQQQEIMQLKKRLQEKPPSLKELRRLFMKKKS